MCHSTAGSQPTLLSQPAYYGIVDHVHLGLRLEGVTCDIKGSTSAHGCLESSMAQCPRLAGLKRRCPDTLSTCNGYIWHNETKLGKGSFGEVFLGWDVSMLCSWSTCKYFNLLLIVIINFIPLYIYVDRNVEVVGIGTIDNLMM